MCVASQLWACVCPLSTVLVFARFPVLYVGCVLRPIYGRVCCVPSVGVCVASHLWTCVLRPICGRVCVPRPLYNRVFSAVRGMCVTSHLWAFVCPRSLFSSYMYYISTWFGHISLRSTMFSPTCVLQFHHNVQHSNILLSCKIPTWSSIYYI